MDQYRGGHVGELQERQGDELGLGYGNSLEPKLDAEGDELLVQVAGHPYSQRNRLILW
jgi:hypothetical protein